MNNKLNNLQQIKQSTVNELKHISLLKKDRNLLLLLIELHDWLIDDENERFLQKLEKLILEKNLNNDEELKVRLNSLQIQLNSNKNIKIIHFPTFSMYFQESKIEIYIKKLAANWNVLTTEIKKIDFDNMQIYVYKSVTKKEKILSIKLNVDSNWEENLLDILNKNVFLNVRITLLYKKKEN